MTDTRKAMEQALDETLSLGREVFKDSLCKTTMEAVEWFHSEMSVRLRSALAQPDDWKKECEDTDKLLVHLGLDPDLCRTDGGWLNLQRIKETLNLPRIKQALEQQQPVEATNDLAEYLSWAFCITKSHAHDLMRLALAQQGEPVDGWKLVPVEPTPEMASACHYRYCAEFVKDYKRMIAAAPAAQPVQGERCITTGWAVPKDHYAVPVLFNPYTGEPRDVRDVQSDPQGILLVPPGKVEMLASNGRPCKVGGDCVAGESSQCACSELNLPTHPSTPQTDARKVIEQMVGALEDRIAKCYAACEGIPTYQLLADAGKPTDLAGIIDALRAEHDEFRKVVEQMLGALLRIKHLSFCADTYACESAEYQMNDAIQAGQQWLKENK